MLKRATIGLAAAACLTFATGAAFASGSIEPLTTVRVASGLGFSVFVTHAPDDYKRLYIVEKRGRIKVLNLETGVINPALFLDIDGLVGGGTTTNNEQGLLGLAFHPDFQNNRYFYVNYTNNSGNTTVRRYTAIDGDTADSTSGVTLLTIIQPFENHNGGWIDFGPSDGYLYIATGDGGAAGDPANRAQDITGQLLGKLLRIDVDGGSPYAIPPSNPFVGVTGDDEIWAYGLRNPWRPSFDRDNGDLYIADVGQNAWEELDFQRNGIPGGRNYGWRCREGAHNFNFSGNCASQTLIEPFHEYGHGLGLSITGGYVYRGCDIPSLRGTYFFADYVSARIWTVNAGGTNTGLTERTSELIPDVGIISRISSFGEDARGELYIVDQGSGSNGEIFKVVPEVPTISPYDIDCDGIVGFSDLLRILSLWGPCDGCLEDLDGDGLVGFSDLLLVLSNWD